MNALPYTPGYILLAAFTSIISHSWANLFRYILQGLVTNELAGNDYHLDVGAILKGSNISQLIAFDDTNRTQSQQLSRILGLVSEIPVGSYTSSYPSRPYLQPFIECTIENGCFAEEEKTLSSSFIGCYLFSGILSRPPCNNEFNAVLEAVNVTEVARCFFDDDEGERLLSPLLLDHRNLLPGQSPDNMLPEDTSNDNNLALVLCLAGALLPDDAVRKILGIIHDLLRIVGVVLEVVDNGISIPGESICNQHFVSQLTFMNNPWPSQSR
jgi:hypothetical protein